jgi:hypothetical protein
MILVSGRTNRIVLLDLVYSPNYKIINYYVLEAGFCFCLCGGGGQGTYVQALGWLNQGI